jgi:peptidoglycan/xylan/chitin deacetylase (PgdA/CDA1 family)
LTGACKHEIAADPVKSRRICLTIDAEFWDSPQFFGLAAEKNREHGNSGCQAVLDLLARRSVRTTFFVSAEFAREHPETVTRIIRDGHEVASHSYSHARLRNLDAREKKFEVVESKKFLEEQFDITVAGFRAPGNEMSQDHFTLVSEAGYRYDSSVHPALLPHRPLCVFQARAPFESEGVVEIPLSTVGGLPVSWIWMRNLGAWLAKAAVYYNRLFGRAAVFYLHSWEFEPLPVVPKLPRAVVRRTGAEFIAMVEGLVCYFQREGFVFEQMKRLADEYLDHHSRT